MAAAAKKIVIVDHLDTKQQIIDRIGDLSGFEIAHNEILLAIYMRPEVTLGGIVLPAQNLKEDLFQAKAHLVLKIGPGCRFANVDIKVHDWVAVKPSDCWALDVNTRTEAMLRSDFVPCRLAYDDRIRAKLSHPAIVW